MISDMTSSKKLSKAREERKRIKIYILQQFKNKA